MKISKVHISKFRSIEKGSFQFNDIISIVGQNNSGKSAIMRALNSFFNPELEISNFKKGIHLYTSKRSIPRITIEFVSIPNNPVYQSFIHENTIKIRQEYKKSRKRLEYQVFKNGKYHSATEELIKELHNDVQFVLIPTERANENNVQDDVSVLRKLLDSFFANHTRKRDTLSPKVRSAFKFFKTKALAKVARGIEDKYLAKKGFKIEIDSDYPLGYELFMNDLAIKIIEDDQNFKLEECGSGIQSLVAISIYRYLSDLTHSNYIIGIEEPEINLHPQAQKELIFELLDQAEDKDIQILFTTHSTVLVDELDHTNIVLVKKTSDSKRRFKTTMHQLNHNFWSNYELQELQYNKFHRFRNSEFFFANHVIVTESPIDSEVFRNLLLTKKIKIERNGISILQLDGVQNLKYAFYILRDLQISKTFILDKDFFFNYQNGSKENSRYASGFFNYDGNLKTNQLISEMLPNESKRNEIKKYLSINHSKAMDKTLEFDILCLKYNLEMDLIASNTACDLIYEKLNISSDKRNKKHLLTQKEKAIKRLDLLVYVINNIPHRNLPHSYRRLIRRIRKVIM